MKTIIYTIIFIGFYCQSYGQNLGNGKIRWNPNHKLQLSDFKIRTDSKSMEPVYSQFIISTNAIGNLEFFKNNFNQKVENIFLGNASWIDTTNTELIERQLEFQQIQFDLSEIQARKYRKQILLNKKKLASGGDLLNDILDSLMTEFSNKRLELFDQTESGTDIEKIDEWKEKIQIELSELSEFNYQNSKKIKISSGY